MSRKDSDGKYKLILMKEMEYVKPIPLHQTVAWKAQHLRHARLMFYHQQRRAASRLRHRAKLSRGYGAPRSREWFDRESAMILCSPTPETFRIWRRYWHSCWLKSGEIYRFLKSITPDQYTKDLHSYLKQLMIVRPPIIHERRKYGNR